MDYKFAYTLPDGDGGERTVQAETEEKAKFKAADLIADFEGVTPYEVELMLIGKGDFSSGKFIECEGCSS
jgi:hypothetical protein